jgi:hypothetical protein
MYLKQRFIDRNFLLNCSIEVESRQANHEAEDERREEEDFSSGLQTKCHAGWQSIASFFFLFFVL